MPHCETSEDLHKEATTAVHELRKKLKLGELTDDKLESELVLLGRVYGEYRIKVIVDQGAPELVRLLPAGIELIA